MSTSSHKPASELGRRLLASARDDGPPESSTERALALVESASAVDKPRAARKRWVWWTLPAAAALFGVALLAVVNLSSEGETPAASPYAMPTVIPDPTAPATATPAATAVAATLPTASAAPSASAAVAAVPTSVAKTTPPESKTAGKGAAVGPRATAKPAKPAAKGSCACAPDDLMCAMRCSQK